MRVFIIIFKLLVFLAIITNCAGDPPTSPFSGSSGGTDPVVEGEDGEKKATEFSNSCKYFKESGTENIAFEATEVRLVEEKEIKELVKITISVPLPLKGGVISDSGRTYTLNMFIGQSLYKVDHHVQVNNDYAYSCTKASNVGAECVQYCGDTKWYYLESAVKNCFATYHYEAVITKRDSSECELKLTSKS
jgi:hypothetical protein